MSAQVSARKQQELQAQYTNYKETLQAIAQKIGDVEQETEEHKLVLETLDPLPGERKCFRMVNGVLVERAVKDVLPQLKTNAEGLKKVLDDLLKQYTAKQEELEKWKRGFMHLCVGVSPYVNHCPIYKAYRSTAAADEPLTGRQHETFGSGTVVR
ncbi:Cochaperone prefoldin complex subunit [Zalaria obscura]|uniref:Cochaperone prefoldin complex subunit n=1 Tax=Zalaria obscura TaxID=2024903 RepID=A0ACC3SNU6_9PEZI